MDSPAHIDPCPSQTAISGVEIPGDLGENTVVIQLPANSAYLSILRTATAGLAALLQFTLDEIEDLRIAVDEACSVLLASHPAAATTSVGEPLASDTTLTCFFTLDGGAITVLARLTVADAPHRVTPSPHSFAWQVLNALADEVAATVDATSIGIRLTKRRAGP